MTRNLFAVRVRGRDGIACLTAAYALVFTVTIIGSRGARGQAAVAAPSAAQAISAIGAIGLQAAGAEALAANPAARAASQQLLQALARADQARAQRRLQISFSSSASESSGDVYQAPPDHESFGTLQNTLTIPLPIGLRSKLAVSQADLLSEAARAQFDVSRIALLTQVNTAYYDLLRKQALLTLAEQTQTEAERALSEAQKRNKAGDVADLDVLRAQVPVASARAQRAQAENAVTVARQAFNSLLARDLDQPTAVQDAQAAGLDPQWTEARIRTLAAQYSADARAADAVVRADEQAVRSARLWREPSVSLDVSDARSGDKTGFSRLDTVQATVTVPLSDGGLSRGQAREAEAALAQARAQLETARNGASTAAGAAFLNARSAAFQSQSARAAREGAQVVYDKTLRGYGQGLFPLSDVLNAQSALAQARIAETQARYDQAAAESSLNLLIAPPSDNAPRPQAAPAAQTTPTLEKAAP